MKVSIEELIERYPKLDREKDNIVKALDIMIDCYEKKGKLLVAGNGGSAADAEHIYHQTHGNGHQQKADDAVDPGHGVVREHKGHQLQPPAAGLYGGTL